MNISEYQTNFYISFMVSIASSYTGTFVDVMMVILSPCIIR